MTSSATASILHRERNLDVRLPYYIFAKFGTLALFQRRAVRALRGRRE